MAQNQVDNPQIICSESIKKYLVNVLIYTNVDLHPTKTRQNHMIGKLTGTLSDKNPPQIVIDCHGVGYEVDVPMSTFYNLPALGEKVSLLTHFVVREDAQILFGFQGAWSELSYRDVPHIHYTFKLLVS